MIFLLRGQVDYRLLPARSVDATLYGFEYGAAYGYVDFTKPDANYYYLYGAGTGTPYDYDHYLRGGGCGLTDWLDDNKYSGSGKG